MQSIDALEDKEQFSHNCVLVDFPLRTAEAQSAKIVKLALAT